MAVEHEAPGEVIQALRQKVLDARTSLPAKYRALFALRNLKGSSAEAAIIDGTFLIVNFTALHILLQYQNHWCLSG